MTPGGLEPPTSGLGILRSIRLSYGAVSCGGASAETYQLKRLGWNVPQRRLIAPCRAPVRPGSPVRPGPGRRLISIGAPGTPDNRAPGDPHRPAGHPAPGARGRRGSTTSTYPTPPLRSLASAPGRWRRVPGGTGRVPIPAPGHSPDAAARASYIRALPAASSRRGRARRAATTRRETTVSPAPPAHRRPLLLALAAVAGPVLLASGRPRGPRRDRPR